MKKSFLFIIALVLASVTIFAQEEPEACFADRTTCAAPDLTAGQRTWDVIKQLPTTELKLNYIADKIILPNFKWIVVSLAGLLLLIGTLLYAKKKTKALKPTLVLLVIGLISLGLLYSVSVYYKEGVEGGIIVCQTPDDCAISMHIHADIEVSVCGEEHIFGFEVGDLSKSHTHKERNKIHWHDLEKVNVETHEIIDSYELTVGAFFEQMGEKFTSECLLDKCVPDSCNGSPGKITMTVNDVPNTELEKYIWSDGDKIVVKYE